MEITDQSLQEQTVTSDDVHQRIITPDVEDSGAVREEITEQSSDEEEDQFSVIDLPPPNLCISQTQSQCMTSLPMPAIVPISIATTVNKDNLISSTEDSPLVAGSGNSVSRVNDEKIVRNPDDLVRNPDVVINPNQIGKQQDDDIIESLQGDVQNDESSYETQNGESESDDDDNYLTLHLPPPNLCISQTQSQGLAIITGNADFSTGTSDHKHVHQNIIPVEVPPDRIEEVSGNATTHDAIPQSRDGSEIYGGKVECNSDVATAEPPTRCSPLTRDNESSGDSETEADQEQLVGHAPGVPNFCISQTQASQHSEKIGIPSHSMSSGSSEGQLSSLFKDAPSISNIGSTELVDNESVLPLRELPQGLETATRNEEIEAPMTISTNVVSQRGPSEDTIATEGIANAGESLTPSYQLSPAVILPIVQHSRTVLFSDGVNLPKHSHHTDLPHLHQLSDETTIDVCTRPNVVAKTITNYDGVISSKPDTRSSIIAVDSIADDGWMKPRYVQGKSVHNMESAVSNEVNNEACNSTHYPGLNTSIARIDAMDSEEELERSIAEMKRKMAEMQEKLLEQKRRKSDQGGIAQMSGEKAPSPGSSTTSVRMYKTAQRLPPQRSLDWGDDLDDVSLNRPRNVAASSLVEEADQGESISKKLRRKFAVGDALSLSNSKRGIEAHVTTGPNAPTSRFEFTEEDEIWCTQDGADIGFPKQVPDPVLKKSPERQLQLSSARKVVGEELPLKNVFAASAVMTNSGSKTSSKSEAGSIVGSKLLGVGSNDKGENIKLLRRPESEITNSKRKDKPKSKTKGVLIGISSKEQVPDNNESTVAVEVDEFDIPLSLSSEEFSSLKFADLWRLLEFAGWTWVKGRKLIDFYYLRPNKTVHAPHLVSHDFFESVDQVTSFVRSQLKQRIKASIPVATSAPLRNESEAIKSEINSAKSRTFPAEVKVVGFTANQNEAVARPNDTYDNSVPDWVINVMTLPWKQLWDHLNKLGWTWNYGSGLVLNWYFVPGCTAATARSGIEKFASEIEVRKYVRRTYNSGYISQSQSQSQSYDLEVPVAQSVKVRSARKVTQKILEQGPWVLDSQYEQQLISDDSDSNDLVSHKISRADEVNTTEPEWISTKPVGPSATVTHSTELISPQANTSTRGSLSSLSKRRQEEMDFDDLSARDIVKIRRSAEKEKRLLASGGERQDRIHSSVVVKAVGVRSPPKSALPQHALDSSSPLVGEFRKSGTKSSLAESTGGNVAKGSSTKIIPPSHNVYVGANILPGYANPDNVDDECTQIQVLTPLTPEQQQLAPGRSSLAKPVAVATNGVKSTSNKKSQLFAGWRILLSGTINKEEFIQTLSSHGAVIVDSIPPALLSSGNTFHKDEAYVLLSDPISFRRINYFKSILIGMPLIHMQWANDSIARQRLQPLHKYFLPSGLSALRPHVVIPTTWWNLATSLQQSTRINVVKTPDSLQWQEYIRPRLQIFEGLRFLNLADSNWTELLTVGGGLVVNKTETLLSALLSGKTRHEIEGKLVIVDFVVVDSLAYCDAFGKFKTRGSGPARDKNGISPSTTSSKSGLSEVEFWLIHSLIEQQIQRSPISRASSPMVTPAIRVVSIDWITNSIQEGSYLDPGLSDVFTMPNDPSGSPNVYKVDTSGSGERYNKYDVVYYKVKDASQKKLGRIISFARRREGCPMQIKIEKLIVGNDLDRQSSTPSPAQVISRGDSSRQSSKELTPPSTLREHKQNGQFGAVDVAPAPNDSLTIDASLLLGKAAVFERADFNVLEYTIGDPNAYCMSLAWENWYRQFVARSLQPVENDEDRGFSMEIQHSQDY